MKEQKNKYTIQFYKVEFPPCNLFWQVPPCYLLPLKLKELQPPFLGTRNPLFRFLRTKLSPNSLGGEDTMIMHYFLV